MAMILVAAFYHFARIADPATLVAPLRALCAGQGVKGSILIAPEGINGTIAAAPEAVADVIAHLRALPGMAALEWKESRADAPPFDRLKVRLKREIVTMGQPDVDPMARVGRHVPPQDWNAVISDPEVVVIDTRNAYEVALGSFAGAIDPGTRAFGEFPAWWAENAARFAGKRIAMFCTGGIRCEKSTNYLLGQGVTDVVHLKGGILKYLEEVPEADSLWQGQCYVFDKRVSVGHGLRPGPYGLCHACGRPLPPEARASPLFEAGVSCPACAGEYSEDDKARFRERQRQIARAGGRGA